MASLVAGTFEFPLPVDIASCLLKTSEASDVQFGVDGGKGKVLDVACLHTTIPENGSRSAQQRFEVQPPAFVCTSKDANRKCRGSVGSVVVEAAFSRQSTDEEYTQWQALMQQWLRTRCERYSDLQQADECNVAFKTFQYYAPTLEGEKADYWRGNLAEWLELDDDADAFANANPSAYGVSGTESALHGVDMGEDDLEFIAYIAKHGEEWAEDPLKVMARFYPPETIKLVQDEVREILSDPQMAATFVGTESQVLQALLGGELPSGLAAAGGAAEPAAAKG